MSYYVERIRNGEIEPYVGEGADGCRRSAAICSDEIHTLAWNDPRAEEIEAQRRAWLDRAERIEGAR